MVEQWKDIIGFNGFYKVSNYGGIQSLKRGFPRILKPYPVPAGYLYITLCADNICKKYKVHRLVLETFVGPCPPGMECRHLDGDPSNNRIDNLCWGTRSENMKDVVKHGTLSINWPNNCGQNNGMSKLNDKKVLEIDSLIMEGIPLEEIARRFKVNRSTVSLIKLRQTWRHLWK